MKEKKLTNTSNSIYVDDSFNSINLIILLVLSIEIEGRVRSFFIIINYKYIILMDGYDMVVYEYKTSTIHPSINP